MPSIVAYLLEQGIEPIADCRTTGQRHPLHDFDPSKRIFERAAEITSRGGTIRLSPDITHMFVGPDHLALCEDYELVCDPTLPPNSMIRFGGTV